jgi:hypothetical protein
MNPVRRELTPDAARAARYDALLPAFDAVYDGLRAANEILARIRD